LNEPQTPLEEASVKGLIRLNQFRLPRQNRLQNATETVENKAYPDAEVQEGCFSKPSQ